jgi:nitric oxide synthase oxygenase domain/subunit
MGFKRNFFYIFLVFISQLCLKMGWTSKRTAFDLLPLILSAEGNDPTWYDYPKEIILEVVLRHPS